MPTGISLIERYVRYLEMTQKLEQEARDLARKISGLSQDAQDKMRAEMNKAVRDIQRDKISY